MPEVRRKDVRNEAPVELVEVPREESNAPIEPRVTVILVGHNQAPALRRAIAALEKSKDRERLEILVIDCGGADDTSMLDTEFPGVSCLRLPHDFGLTKTLNIGARTAKAEFLFYLSPNVEVAPDTITRLADALDSDTDLSAVAPLLIDEKGNAISKLWALPMRDSLAAVCAGQALRGTDIDASQESVAIEYPSIDALLVRKYFVKAINFFDERFGHRWADADLAMQIKRTQKKARLYPAIRVTMHDAPDPRAKDSLLQVDCVLGAAAYLGKYDGFMAGFTFRLGAIFGALGKLQFGKLGALLSGQKLDGTQAM